MAERYRIIVSRHPAAVEFIRAEKPEFVDAPVLASATPEDVRGKIVAGNIPLHLAALAAEVWAVEFDGAPPRGAEYGLEEMRAAGARMACYRVEAVVAFPADLQSAVLHTLTLSGSEPTIRTELVGQDEDVVLGPGQNDRHNQTMRVRLSPGRQYLLVRDARYRGRGPGNALAGMVSDACGNEVAGGYSGHPHHDGTWNLFDVPPSGIDAVSGVKIQRRLVVRQDGTSELCEVPVTV